MSRFCSHLKPRGLVLNVSVNSTAKGPGDGFLWEDLSKTR